MRRNTEDQQKTLVREAIKNAEIDADRVREWTEMVETRAWKMFVATLYSIIEDKGSLLLEPVLNQSAVLKQEYEKGTMRGILLAMSLPVVAIEASARDEPAGPLEEDEEE